MSKELVVIYRNGKMYSEDIHQFVTLDYIEANQDNIKVVTKEYNPESSVYEYLDVTHRVVKTAQIQPINRHTCMGAVLRK